MERSRNRQPQYDEPFVWWGPVWQTPPERTVVDLIRDGVLAMPVAALLWGLLARRASIIVAAGPSGAGKTTVLTALLDCLPPGTRRLYLRGCYESFAFLDDPGVDPARSVLLVNEISAHLPSYLWGPGVRRALAATRRGFSLAATAHATSIADLIGQLAGYPLRVPARELAAIDVVVLVTTSQERGRGQPRIAEVWWVAAGQGQGLTVDLLATAHNISHKTTSLITSSPRIPSSQETSSRVRFLDSLLSDSTPLAPADIRRAFSHYESPGTASKRR